MSLPAITLPKIELPFDIPLLLHPPVDHFVIALPIIILLLELINLILKKRAISGISLFLLLLTVVAAVSAYLTGSVDGKEAFPLLTEVAKEELKDHKLLGTYLMLFSVVVFIFKLLSMIISKGLMKALYMLILILFVVGILNQGKDGGELVYEHGVNVEKVKVLDDELFDTKEELEDLKDELKEEKASAKEETSHETEISHTETNTTSPKEADETPKKPEVEIVPMETSKPEISTH